MDQHNPLVSVIIPTFNRPDFVRRAIRSVQNQTYTNIEILVIDDHSDYDISTIQQGFPGIILMQNSTNKGACYSRNRGLEEAKGMYINFLDDDDELFPEKIEQQIEVFKSSEDKKLGMVTCHLIDQRSGQEIRVRNRTSGDIYKELLMRYAVSGTETMLFKKDVVTKVGGFDENLPANHEYDLLIRVCENHTVDFVDEVLTKRHRSIDQININFDKKIQGAKLLFKKHDWRYQQQGSLFWVKMRIKLNLLLIRFYTGKFFGEKAYRLTLVD